MEGIRRARAGDAADRRPLRPRSSSTRCPTRFARRRLALGAPRWKVIFRVVIPTALPGIVTGSLLAGARGAGRRLRSCSALSIATGTTFDLNGPMNALPLPIFPDLKQPRAELVNVPGGRR